MASERALKKEINKGINNVIDESYSIQLYDASKKKKTDALIDEVVKFKNEIITSINAATNKKEFKTIKEKFEKAKDKWKTQLSKL